MSSGSRILPPRADYKLPSGRKFVYDVEWRLWTVGTATLRVDAGGGEQKVTATADSMGAVSLLYLVRDSFESFFDPRTFCSSRISKNIHEGSRRRETRIRFDSTRQKAVLQERNLDSGASKQAEGDMPPCVSDVVSALFYVASLPLAEDAMYVFPVNDGGDTTDVRVSVEGAEEITTPAGAYRAIRVRAETMGGRLKHGSEVWVWYADEAERIPVQMRARMSWGTLTLRLQRSEPTATGNVR